MAITLKDIAAEVGVQVCTVSMVLNNHPKAESFTEETRSKIRAVAARLGYTPNAAARALATKRTNNLAFIIPEYSSGRWSNPYYSDFLNGIEEVCSKNNFGLFVHCCNLQNVLEFIIPQGVRECNVDGLIISNSASSQILKRFEEIKLPCVRVGASGGGANCSIPMFSPNLLDGLLETLRYLKELGHRRIVLFEGGSEHMSSLLYHLKVVTKEKFTADEIDLQTQCTSDNRCDESSAVEFFDKYLSTSPESRPTAVITNPQTCMGIIDLALKNNISIPGDLSVVSNYEYDLFAYLSPSLTSMQYDNSAIAAAATELLIKNINAKKKCTYKMSDQSFPVKLIHRNSCHYIKTN